MINERYCERIIRQWSQKFNVSPPSVEMRPIAKKVIRKRKTRQGTIVEELMKPVGQYRTAERKIIVDPVWAPHFGLERVLRHEFIHHVQHERGIDRTIGIGGKGKRAGIESNARKVERLLELFG